MVHMLRCLPPFPILVDYRDASWTEREENLALAAIRHRSRVHGIALGRPNTSGTMTKLLRAPSHPFPELESLKICPPGSHRHDREVIFPTTLLSGSAPCLRQLTLRGVVPRCLSPPLSYATGLVELTLTLRVEYRALPEAPLIANLKRMVYLRRLQLKLEYVARTPSRDGQPPPTGAGDVVTLSNLMEFVFAGRRMYLEALLVVLAAPSLQCLDADLRGTTDAFPIPRLCGFICDTGNQFDKLRLDFSHARLKFTAETHSKSVRARIVYHEPISLVEMGNRLSGPLSTVERLVVWADAGGAPFIHSAVQWCRFFHNIRQVKVVQVPSEVALDVAHSFQLDGQEPAMDLLPALELVRWLWHTGAAKTMRLSLMHLSPLLLHGRGWDAP
jgi:hypothetical protein